MVLTYKFNKKKLIKNFEFKKIKGKKNVIIILQSLLILIVVT